MTASALYTGVVRHRRRSNPPREFQHRVAFYYSFDREERLDAVVAEVTNTPWGERRAYVLRPEGEAAVPGVALWLRAAPRPARSHDPEPRQL